MKHLNGPIRYGTCIEQFGLVIQESNGVKFIEAAVELDGMIYGSGFKDFLKRQGIDLTTTIHLPKDAIWVSGRLQRLFRTSLAPAEVRGSDKYLYFSFLAQAIGEDSQVINVPLICADRDGLSGVCFSENSPPEISMVQNIENAFWSLVAADPMDCYVYLDYVWDNATGQKFEFGIDNDKTPFINAVS